MGNLRFASVTPGSGAHPQASHAAHNCRLEWACRGGRSKSGINPVDSRLPGVDCVCTACSACAVVGGVQFPLPWEVRTKGEAQPQGFPFKVARVFSLQAPFWCGKRLGGAMAASMFDEGGTEAVKVVARVRPMNAMELEKQSPVAVETEGLQHLSVVVRAPSKACWEQQRHGTTPSPRPRGRSQLSTLTVCSPCTLPKRTCMQTWQLQWCQVRCCKKPPVHHAMPHALSLQAPWTE